MKHAILSASSASRWLACPPSARLNAMVADQPSQASKEGTLAHALAEYRLARKLNLIETNKDRLQVIKANKLYCAEMEEYVQGYVDYCMKFRGKYSSIYLEKRVDFSKYAPDGFGTADCVIVNHKPSNPTLHIIDFKYGRGMKVSANRNEQLKLYAIGASFLYPWIENIRLHIYQPRKDNISVQATTRAELLAWGESIKGRAKLAYQGEGQTKTGKHCKFCKVKGRCKAHIHQNIGALQKQLFDAQEMGIMLKTAKELMRLGKEIENQATYMAIEGAEIDGWALEARPLRRVIKNESEAFRRLINAKVDADCVFSERQFQIAKAEKLLGKKKFDTILGDLVEMQYSAPRLVKKGTSAIEDFNDKGE